jgi:hydroxymethylbilane synthase
MPRKLVIGTRGSALALRQTEIVTERLRAAVPGIEMETRVVRTEGDRRQDVSLEEFGGQGVFVKDIEALLLDGEIDLAVHSLKDMPAQTSKGLIIGAVLERGDVHDVLVSRGNLTLTSLQTGARVGTDSRRRTVQLLAMRPDLRVESIRGNVDTRIRKAESGEFDAVVLAAAGLERLGLADKAAQVFSRDEMLPAVGQAVLAVERRADDPEVREALDLIDHQDTRSAISAERAYLLRLGAGCRLPVAAYGLLESGRLRVRGLLATDGAIYRDEVSGPPADAEVLGTKLAERLLAEAGLESVSWQ